MEKRVVISGIGSGGHYFPAVVVASEFSRRKIKTIFLVRRGFPEEDIAREYGLKTFPIRPSPYYGKPLFDKLIALWRVIESVYRLNRLTKGCIGISFGGFGSVPLILSCMINRSSFYLFEPNRIPGRTTKLFASYAKRVFLGIPSGVKIKGRLMLSGIPLRKEIKDFAEMINRAEKKTVLFIGGSQGAKRLNELAIALQKILPQEFKIIIMSGRRDFEWVNSQKDHRTEVIPFTTEPWKFIIRASIVIARAGALSGYELMAMKKRVIFIPFPYGVDDHQYYNAQFFAQMPNARLELEKDINENILLQRIIQMMEEKELIEDKGFIIKNAEELIVDTIMEEQRWINS